MKTNIDKIWDALWDIQERIGDIKTELLQEGQPAARSPKKVRAPAKRKGSSTK